MSQKIQIYNCQFNFFNLYHGCSDHAVAERFGTTNQLDAFSSRSTRQCVLQRSIRLKRFRFIIDRRVVNDRPNRVV